MKKTMVICAAVAALGAAALSSTQASASTGNEKAAALSSAPRSPHAGWLLGERRPNIQAFGLKFRVTNKESPVCGVWGSSCFY